MRAARLRRVFWDPGRGAVRGGPGRGVRDRCQGHGRQTGRARRLGHLTIGLCGATAGAVPPPGCRYGVLAASRSAGGLRGIQITPRTVMAGNGRLKTSGSSPRAKSGFAAARSRTRAASRSPWHWPRYASRPTGVSGDPTWAHRARTGLDELIKTQPANGYAYLKRGAAWYHLNDYAPAEADWQTAAWLLPDNETPRENLGALHKQQAPGN